MYEGITLPTIMPAIIKFNSQETKIAKIIAQQSGYEFREEGYLLAPANKLAIYTSDMLTYFPNLRLIGQRGEAYNINYIPRHSRAFIQKVKSSDEGGEEIVYKFASIIATRDELPSASIKTAVQKQANNYISEFSMSNDYNQLSTPIENVENFAYVNRYRELCILHKGKTIFGNNQSLGSRMTYLSDRKLHTVLTTSSTKFNIPVYLDMLTGDLLTIVSELEDSIVYKNVISNISSRIKKLAIYDGRIVQVNGHDYEKLSISEVHADNQSILKKSMRTYTHGNF